MYAMFLTRASCSYSRGIGTIWLDDVDCPNTRTPLLQCRHNSLGSHNCVHSEDVALICTTTPSSESLIVKVFCHTFKRVPPDVVNCSNN